MSASRPVLARRTAPRPCHSTNVTVGARPTRSLQSHRAVGTSMPRVLSEAFVAWTCRGVAGPKAGAERSRGWRRRGGPRQVLLAERLSAHMVSVRTEKTPEPRAIDWRSGPMKPDLSPAHPDDRCRRRWRLPVSMGSVALARAVNGLMLDASREESTVNQRYSQSL
jgi:hypothetical protein